MRGLAESVARSLPLPLGRQRRRCAARTCGLRVVPQSTSGLADVRWVGHDEVKGILFESCEQVRFVEMNVPFQLMARALTRAISRAAVEASIAWISAWGNSRASASAMATGAGADIDACG